jgi:uncharacterized protein YdhG (YjbR/CyaY superfamily)
MKYTSAHTVDQYIAEFPKSAQTQLKQLRTTIQKAAPLAQEKIAYSMPAYTLGGKPLVYFGAYPHHIGFYATPTGHTAFKKELSKYKTGKGSVQFPLDQPMPLTLITKIVRFRVQEILNIYKQKTR